MNTRDPRPKVPQDVMDAAMALVNTLAGNQEFRDRIAEEEIADRVEAGKLIPIERLTIAEGLVLTPAGFFPALERAARVVVKAWLDIPGEQGWTEEEVILSRAIKHLAALFDQNHLGDDTVDDLAADAVEAELAGDDVPPAGDVTGDVDEQEPVVDEPTGDPVASDDDEDPAAGQVSEAGPPGKPQGMPDVGDEGPCEQCGAVIEEPQQAQLSWILSRRKLCRSCHIGDEPPPPEPDQEEEDDDGDDTAGEP